GLLLDALSALANQLIDRRHEKLLTGRKAAKTVLCAQKAGRTGWTQLRRHLSRRFTDCGRPLPLPARQPHAYHAIPAGRSRPSILAICGVRVKARDVDKPHRSC